MTRRRYSADFVQEAVALVAGGRRVGEVADTLGVPHGSVWNWVAKADGPAPATDPTPADRDQGDRRRGSDEADRRARTGGRVPGKSVGLLRRETPADAVIFPWVAEQASQYPITMQCRLLGVARSSYYAWQAQQDRPPTAREMRHRELTAAIVTCFTAAKGRLGRRPMQQVLARDGIRCAPGTVHRIMAGQDLQAGRSRACRRTTQRDPAARTAHITNHCLDADGHRCFLSPIPGTKTVGDITYLPTREGWQYLAVVLDLATRAVVGWALRPTLHTALVTAAVTMADQHGCLADGAIFHRDRGSQYTSQAFQDHCAGLGVTQSMGAVGTCWDNAVAESVFATLKSDLVAEVGTFASRANATAWVVTYIEGWSNRQRPHTHNQGRPPVIAWHDLRSPSLAVQGS